MNRNITVLVYLEYHDESAARKTLDSVFEQQIEGDMQVIVCDLASALEEGIYDYSERDLIYISVKEQMTRFDLEMALREQIESPYFTVIYDGEYFTDRKYLQRAVDFLDGEKDFSCMDPMYIEAIQRNRRMTLVSQRLFYIICSTGNI